MSAIKQIGPIEEKYRGKSFQITHRLMKTGEEKKVFEEAHRAPGTRSIILSSDKSQILLTKEHRHQLEKVDVRLPGGKVFDSLQEYLQFVGSNQDILQFAEAASKKEILEETGQIADEIKFLKATKCGGMMDWDLYYFVVTKSHSSNEGQKLGPGEEIETVWIEVKEAVRMCLEGEIAEDRSASVLLQFLHSESKAI